MGQTNKRELQLHIEPEKKSYRMAKAIAPQRGQSFMDAARESSAAVDVDISPEKRWYTEIERDLSPSEKVSSAIGSIFGNR